MKSVHWGIQFVVTIRNNELSTPELFLKDNFKMVKGLRGNMKNSKSNNDKQKEKNLMRSSIKYNLR